MRGDQDGASSGKKATVKKQATAKAVQEGDDDMNDRVENEQGNDKLLTRLILWQAANLQKTYKEQLEKKQIDVLDNYSQKTGFLINQAELIKLYVIEEPIFSEAEAKALYSAINKGFDDLAKMAIETIY